MIRFQVPEDRDDGDSLSELFKFVSSVKVEMFTFTDDDDRKRVGLTFSIKGAGIDQTEAEAAESNSHQFRDTCEVFGAELLARFSQAAKARGGVE